MSETKKYEIDSNIKIMVTYVNSNLGENIIKYLLEKNYPSKNIITTVRSLQKRKKMERKRNRDKNSRL